MNRLRSVSPLLALALLVLPIDADAQVRRGRAPAAAPRWAPISVGVRAGWDQRANGAVLGGQLRLPVVRSGIVELAPNAGVTFLDGAKEYQYNLEATVVPGGARGGVFFGGGVGWRDTVSGTLAPTDITRETVFGYVVSLGGRTDVGRVQLELGVRWIFLDDSAYRPNPVTLGVSYPLWQGASGAGS